MLGPKDIAETTATVQNRALALTVASSEAEIITLKIGWKRTLVTGARCPVIESAIQSINHNWIETTRASYLSGRTSPAAAGSTRSAFAFPASAPPIWTPSPPRSVSPPAHSPAKGELSITSRFNSAGYRMKMKTEHWEDQTEQTYYRRSTLRRNNNSSFISSPRSDIGMLGGRLTGQLNKSNWTISVEQITDLPKLVCPNCQLNKNQLFLRLRWPLMGGQMCGVAPTGVRQSCYKTKLG